MRPISFFIMTAFILTACGTKGPLYIPEQRYPQDTTEPAKPEKAREPVINEPSESGF